MCKQKYGDDDMDTDTDSDIAGNGGLPVFQTLLLSFLDNKAPYLGKIRSNSSDCLLSIYSNNTYMYR